MQVLFDHQIFTIQEFGGISRYFFELIQRFHNNSDSSASLSTLLSNNAYIHSGGSKRVKEFFPGRRFKGKDRIIDLVNRSYSIYKIKEQAFDILHPTYYDPYFLKHIKNKPFVVTVLDLIHEKFENEYAELRSDKLVFSNKKALINSATKILAISQSTKDDIVQYYGISPEKIHVTHLGSSLDVNIINRRSRIIEKPYLLFVGTRASYKNFDFFLESIAESVRHHNLYIVCAGGGPFSPREIELIKRLNLANLIQHHPINDSTLQNFYENAEAFVFPSKYEGFGIPVLEAFSCNCPCLLSKGGSLPEVGGDAALYFDPNNSEELCRGLNQILFDTQLKDKLLKNAQERRNLFSWDQTFQQTMNVYQTLI